MQVTAGNMQIESTSGKEPVEPPPATSTLPETEMYAFLLVLSYAVDQKKYQQVGLPWPNAWP